MLYRACANSFSKNVKAMALVQGAENINLDEDWYDVENISTNRAMAMHDMPGIASSGLSLGYEMASE